MVIPNQGPSSSFWHPLSHIHRTLLRPLDALQGAQAFVEPRYSQIVLMTLSLVSLVPLDRQNPELLLVRHILP